MTQLNIHQWFDQSAERYESKPAISREGRQLTYRELAACCNRMANFLLANRVPPGSLIGILTQDIFLAVPAIIASLKAGCAFVPLDPAMPVRRMAAVCNQVSMHCVVTDSVHLPLLEQLQVEGVRARYICADRSPLESPPGSLSLMPGFELFNDIGNPHLKSDGDALCSIYFTSGSAGKPKAIAGRLKGIDHFIRWQIAALQTGEDVRVSQLLSLSFDGSLRDIFVPLCAGGMLCAPPDRDTILDAPRLIEWLDRERIELVHCVPSLFRSMVHEVATGSLDVARLQSLRHIVMAGEPLLPADVRKWMEIYGQRCQLVNLYGQTETTMAKFAHLVRPEDLERRTIPIGKPIEGCMALLLDEGLQPCPPGAIGEIYLRTSHRSLGYYNDPELNQRTFVRNPFQDDPADLIYKTGDQARQAEDGSYEFVGRRDRQVKVRGVRIELAEIEQVLLEHPLVREAAVIDRQDSQGYTYICTYIVPEDGGDNLSGLALWAEATLPHTHLPAAYVLLKQLPRTISGKIDLRLLVAPSQSADAYVAPETEIEKTLAEIWGELLVLRVGLHDNFFRLGGHSLLATQLLSRIRMRLDVEIPLRTLFEAPVLQKQALMIAAAVARKTDEGELARIVADVQALSPEELQRVLQEEIDDSVLSNHDH